MNVQDKHLKIRSSVRCCTYKKIFIVPADFVFSINKPFSKNEKFVFLNRNILERAFSIPED